MYTEFVIIYLAVCSEASWMKGQKEESHKRMEEADRLLSEGKVAKWGLMTETVNSIKAEIGFNPK